MPQPESKTVKKIQRRISRDGRAFKIHGGDNPFQEVGIPDLLVCYRGRFVGLEVKEPGNSPSAVQKRVLYEIVKAGGYAAVLSTVEELENLLAYIDREATGEAHANGPNDALRRRILERSIARYGG